MDSEKLTLQDEKRLVERARAGDGEAFGAIYDAFRDVLFATVIYPQVNDPDAAREVLQETFLLALRKIGSFRWQDRSIFFWLRMIAINKAREWRHTRRHGDTVDDSVLAWLPDNSFQPENAVMEVEHRRELADKIRQIMSAMNERYRETIDLRLLKGLSRVECATAIGVTVETFDVVFFRACRSFRETWEKMFGDPPPV